MSLAKMKLTQQIKHHWLSFENYPISNLKNYPIGFEGSCLTCDYEANSEDYLYIIDSKNPLRNILLTNFQTDEEFQEIPLSEVKKGDLVGVEYEDMIFRGLISDIHPHIELFLIDVGAYIKDPINRYYLLSKKWQQEPALAMLVHAIEIPKNGIQNHSSYNFKVLNIKNNILEVKFTEKEKEKQITDEELAILNSEFTETTSNALYAATGYVSTDDSRYCKFYDGTSGSCFKGANCKFIHEAKDADGWTKDKMTVIANIQLKLEIPQIGEKLILKPTFVTSVNTFFAHIHHERKPGISLSKFHRALNQEVGKYKKYDKNIHPSVGELVLVKYHRDGKFYRGKVSCIENGVIFSIFFVDYGNTDLISIIDMYKWDSLFEVLPFQAMQFVVANIVEILEVNDGREALQEAISGKNIEAKVIENRSDIFVTIFDGTHDIGEYLISTKKAAKREFVRFSSHSSIIPA